jgi:hypothetical protein
VQADARQNQHLFAADGARRPDALDVLPVERRLRAAVIEQEMLAQARQPLLGSERLAHIEGRGALAAHRTDQHGVVHYPPVRQHRLATDDECVRRIVVRSRGQLHVGGIDAAGSAGKVAAQGNQHTQDDLGVRLGPSGHRAVAHRREEAHSHQAVVVSIPAGTRLVEPAVLAGVTGRAGT